MGAQHSKRTLDRDVLISYESACQLDPDLQTFDTAIQARTNHVINTLAVGVEVRSLSFDSLKDVTGCLLETNQEVVKIILNCKEDIWNNKELLDFVEQYFENSLQTLDFCTALEKCLKRACDSEFIIQLVLQQFEEEDGFGGKKYSKTIQELKNFKAAGDPFTEEFFQAFQSVYNQHLSMLEKLKIQKSKLDKKLKYLKVWRKVSNFVFAAAFASVLICSAVVAAMATPHLVAALVAAMSAAVGPVGKWIDSLWKDYQVALKEQKGIVSAMQVGTFVAIKDLDSIRVLVDRLEIEIESLLQNAEFALREEDAVKFGIEEIKKKLELFTRSIKDLGDQADRCSRDIRMARTVVLQRIIRKSV
ncbi:UPF0496 protein 1-like [Tasmannia lanceolata]|uniref:UPF0496 protein 1-like n=1 Tax=Tasmannia lanceolata TaxID=3420 RepID=UPI004063CD68